MNWIDQIMQITGTIPANEHITQSQRSRLAALHFDDVTAEDDVTNSQNHVDQEVFSIDTSGNPEPELDATSTTQSAVESTSPESTSPESTSPGSTSPESTSPISTSPESTTLESTTPEVTESTTPEVTVATLPQAAHSAAYDDSPWMPIHVATLPELTTESAQMIPEASTASAIVTYELSSLQTEEESTLIPPASADSGIDDSADSGIDSTTSKPSGSKKFSFLDWFSAQLASAELELKSAPEADFPEALPAPTSEQPISSSTRRFFTIRPTAISYSGIQPLLRPKPLTPPSGIPEESSRFPVESPRNQKSVEVDLFPPMRRPSSAASSIRSEPSSANHSGSADASGNSPIYTFILNKGQSVQDVLTQLLSDLTTAEPEAEVEAEASTAIPEEEQPDNKAIAGDVRLQSWNSDASFRPSALNNLIRIPASAPHPEATTNSSSGKLLINPPLDLSKWNYSLIYLYF